MSLPKFPDIPKDDFMFDQSICQILTSIAMEEIGLSHIINAEGEKLQYILGTGDAYLASPATIDEVLEVNESVQETLNQIAFNQMFLSAKMAAALKAYSKDKESGNGGNGSSGGNGNTGPDVEEPLPPVENPPEVIDGSILPPAVTGDTADWIEIARYGKYILIVRSKYINIYVNGHHNEPNWQYIPYGSTNAYKSSNVRQYINSWFSGPVKGTADKLADNARLRQFTMQNNAVNVLGTGSSNSGGLLNGFSKPTDIQIPSGSDDIAFALSFTEVANFISKMYSTDGAGDYADSNSTAVKNYNKIEIPAGIYGMWLRSPGSSSYTAGELSSTNGTAFQFHLSPDKIKEYGLVYPALWVDSEILS